MENVKPARWSPPAAILANETMPDLLLLGGPLQWLGRRLGLVRQGTTIWMGVALGLFTWGVLSSLELLQGFGSRIFSLATIAVPVRFLVAIPLFFLCEAWAIPQMAEFTRYIVQSGLVAEASLPALASDIRHISRMNDSWLAESLLLLAALASPLIELTISLPGRTASWVSILHSSGTGFTWADGWYLGFCLPLFRFLVLRWLWRLGLWFYLLWRMEGLNLRLIPIHSDGAAGLGYLEIVHSTFVPLVLAISAVCSAGFAEEISSGSMAFDSLYSSIAIVILLSAALFIGPLFMFSPRLYVCRCTGMSEYMALASRYVNTFDGKWIHNGQSTSEALLGTPDLQALADLTTSLKVVRRMQSIPFGQRLVLELALSAVLPLLPLILFKLPVSQVAARLFHILAGL
jgi:hypothetical protein